MKRHLLYAGLACLTIVPVALAQTFAVSMVRIAAFTIGIVVAMSAYGLLAGKLLSRTNQADGRFRKQKFVFRMTTAGVALFCVVAGLLTLSERLHS